MARSTIQPLSKRVNIYWKDKSMALPGDTEAAHQSGENFVGILQARARLTPDRQAFGFLRDAGTDEDVLTYQDLDRQARMIAAQLGRLGLQGERAVLLYQPGLDYVRALFGCLYAGVVAVPVYAPRLNSSYERVRQTVASARAAALLSVDAILSNIDRNGWHDLRQGELRWIATDLLDLREAAAYRVPVLHGDDLAILQFTSGSTGVPKGVMLQHRHLIANSAAIRDVMGCGSDSVGVVWIPPYHDMGLIGGILQPVFSGFPMHLLSPYSFLQRPMRWLTTIMRYQATHSSAPNFAYQLCADRVKPTDLAALDLSSWRIAANGSEPIREQTLARFSETFAACGFRGQSLLPCYGMAEATLLATGARREAGARTCQVNPTALALGAFSPEQAPDSLPLVSSGIPAAGVTVRIVDPVGHTPCGAGQIGEIWLQGDSIAAGYWDLPEQTAETFRARLSGEAGDFLRTGDLGCLHEGELYVTGRIKDVIIIRGQNHYPHDIEATVAGCHPALCADGTAAFSLELQAGEALAVVQEVERGYRGMLTDLESAIRDAVSRHHQLSIARLALVRPRSVPKTSSGKVRRLACRALLLDQALQTFEVKAG
jgi:acyl-CoA synthetase (AMP-forming)/AMP-acid ligase II